MRRMTPTEAKVMAMAIDCEGFLGISKYRDIRKLDIVTHFRPDVALTNTNTVLIDYFNTIYSGQIYESDKRRAYPNRKTLWRWEPLQSDILDFTKQIRPYLIIKQQQADIILEYYKKFYFGRHHHFGKGGVTGSYLPEYVIIGRQLLYNRMRILNKRGK